jgi:lysozyme
MNISSEGIRLIKSFEGYHKKLENGDCTAYQTYLGGGKYDIPTIGYGCTVGIKMGMVWSEAQATDALMVEVAKHEAYVTQYVTVPINQNEFDALVSFSYNVGPANLKKLVKRLNNGDRVATAKAFLLYVKAQGRTLPGLVSRRTRESALFQKPVEAPSEPYMPQTVQKALEPPSAPAVATATATGGGFIYTAWQYLGDKFNSFFDGLDQEQAMMLLGTAQKHGVSSGWINIVLCAAAGVGLYVLIGHVFPKLAGSKT